MRRKKRISILLVLVTVVMVLAGCKQGDTKKTEESVFTGNPDAMKVFVRVSSTYAQELEAQFPDIDFDFYYYGGLNASMMMNHLLQRDDFGDLCITSLQVTDEEAKEHLIDLSGSGICSRYEPSILSQFDVDGEIYQLPGYVTMRNVIYNKDIFKSHGWKEPRSFDELTALCRQIREEEPELTPIVMAAAASGYHFTTMTSYAQSEFLYTPEGKQWMQDYHEGKADAEDGFGEGIRMVQELIDAGAFDYETGDGVWDGELFQKQMLTDQAAMMFVWGGQIPVAQTIAEHPEKHFGMMPFYNREGQAFIGTNIPYYIGLSKNLEKKGNEKKLEQAMRILEWLSTEEGIDALSSDTLAAVYPLRSSSNGNILDTYQKFWNDNLDSIKAPMLYAGYEDILAPVADVIIEAVQGKRRLDGLAEYIDEIHGDYLQGGTEAIKAGSFAQDFTHAETVQLMADVLHSRGDSDIALVSDGTDKNGILNYGGVFSRFRKGAVLEDELTCWVPGAEATRKMVRMKLSGRQIKTLLEKGKHGIIYQKYGKTARVESEKGAVAAATFDYYWSGMDVEWKKDRVEKIHLSNGRVLEDDKLCTVVFAGEDYTEELERLGRPEELPYTAAELFQEYMQDKSPVKPIPVLRD